MDSDTMLRSWLTGTGSVITLILVIVACSLGALYIVLHWLGPQARRAAAAEKQLQEQDQALREAQMELERLRRIPRAELMPMLKLAHELRSPLAAIQSALDMLLQGYANGNAGLRDEMLDLARDRTEAMLARVNDFLRLGAVRHAESARAVQPVQLGTVLLRLAPELHVRAKWRAVELHIDVPDSLPMVNATPEDMEHLLSNLTNNAIKYTEPGGRVAVTLRRDPRGVTGIVEDNGIGISRDDLDRIFDDFYRGEAARDIDAHGSGLGLSIVKRVVDTYGGQLSVESELGKGSRFTFVFPTGADSQSSGEPPPLSTATDGQEQSHTGDRGT